MNLFKHIYNIFFKFCINTIFFLYYPKSDLVEFCAGFKVSKSKLDAVMKKPLGKVNDGTFVKELAVLVFGFKCLYNSSLSERKYTTKSNEQENKNKVPRKKLDEKALAEIQGMFTFNLGFYYNHLWIINDNFS